MRDRSMQALHLMALDPISETKADANSYGFRKHRSTHDAIDQAFKVLGRKDSATWVLDADIAGCFDNISHQWMLEHIPMDKAILQQWLESGYVETKGNLFPTTAGTPQGGIASPCLCNMVLDGLERVVKTAVKSGRQINFIRYADDFIVTARHRSDLENTILPAIEQFLTERGLTLSKEKTAIRHIRQGFDFLGQNLRKYNHGKLMVTPSKKNVKAFLAKARETIKSSHGHQLGVVIGKLNPKIRGWANYHRQGSPSKRYTDVDHQLAKAIWRFLKRSHSDKSIKWITAKYMRRDPKQRGRLTWSHQSRKERSNKTQKGEINCLKLAATTELVTHLKVRGKANPYDPKDRTYFRWMQGLRKAIRAGKWKPPWKPGKAQKPKP